MDKQEETIVKTARKTIQIEKESLETLLDKSITSDFIAATKHIFNTKGRVVLTGIGKSAIVAQKIVATLNSTGTPSIFMHAADAIHGDLGMIQENDTVLCLSKSGETPEVKVLVPLIRNLGNVLIGMVSKKTSFLGQQADYILWTPISKEADPNNLAPTASTTVQMAMGDALATALLALRGFTHQDFARFHPGGALGKQLYLRVKDIYVKNEQPKVQLDESLRNVILEMTSKRLGATAVLDKEQHLKGIITDGDLRRMLTTRKNVAHIKAKDIMSAHPKTIQYDELAVNALTLMRTQSINQLVVLHDRKYMGIVHLHDLIQEGFV